MRTSKEMCRSAIYGYNKNSKSDRVNLYTKELVTLGLLYKEFANGIRERDGNECFAFGGIC